MNDKRRNWAKTSRELGAARTSVGPLAALSARQQDSVDQAAQREMTGVSWDPLMVDISRIRQVGAQKARHRFRAALPDLIWNAAALEGNTFTLPEVRTLLDGVTVQGRRIEEEQQILALSEGYSLVDDLIGEGAFRLDKKRQTVFMHVSRGTKPLNPGISEGRAPCAAAEPSGSRPAAMSTASLNENSRNAGRCSWGV